MTLSRRDLLKIGLVGAAAAVLPLERIAHTSGSVKQMSSKSLPRYFSLPFRRPPELAPVGTVELILAGGLKAMYPRYDVVQRFGVAEILPGYQTPVFGYNGVVPGPTIHAYQGTPIVVNQANLLHQQPTPPYDGAMMPSPYSPDPMQRWTSTHLHGSASLPQYDGYASDITLPGQAKSYVYPNSQEARTLWYHDHGVHHTAQNAYNGLAGIYILHDPVERQLGIPTGDYDVPVVFKDAMFATDGSLIYEDNSESGIYGDVILVNGVPWPEMVVERRKYRFRFLNASVSRSYTWQLSDGRAPVPMTVIATDAGFMPRPQVVTSLRQAMAERYEVVIDFAKYPDNALLVLQNLLPKNNINYDGVKQAMRFRVRGDATSSAGNSVPTYWEDLVRPAECMTWTEAGLRTQQVPRRTFEFVRTNGHWTINGETWEDVVSSGYTHCMAEPDLGAVEVWELVNTSGGWFHPVHIHLVDFQVLSRNGSAANVLPHEKGPKDVVYLAENETIRVAMRFSGPPAGPGWPAPKGRYMMHCHNLVHEDHDMMMQFSVGDPDHDVEFDPIEAARPWSMGD